MEKIVDTKSFQDWRMKKTPELYQKPVEEKIDLTKRVAIPASYLPVFRTTWAIQNGVERKILFRTWGGIGDQVCAEPTIRYAIKMFKDCDIYIASHIPELFKHLPVKRIFNLEEETPNYSKYYVFETITPPDESNLVWQFMNHMITNCVDFVSLCALRLQLPIAHKEIILSGTHPANGSIDYNDRVVVHPGKHWQSKTFPKDFWDAVISELVRRGIEPVIIGANADDNRGTVDVDTNGCLDLRNKLSLSETTWLLQRAKVLLTNDSAPLHIAASGHAHIGYIATIKHPDMITHWRRSIEGPMIWQWREVNFGRGGIWDIIDFCPNKQQQLDVESVPEEMLRSWLPDPIYYASWAADIAEGMP